MRQTIRAIRPLSPAQRKRLNDRILALPDSAAQRKAAAIALSLYGPPPEEVEQTIQERFSPYRFDPAGYLQRFLGWEPWSGLDEQHPGQLEILSAIVIAIRQQIEKIAFEKGEIKEKDLEVWKPGTIIQNWIRVESGNGIGKTKTLSGVAQWFLDCFESVVQTYHTTATQDRLTTWAEINQDRAGKNLPGRLLETEIKIAGNRFAISRTTSDAKGTGEERVKGKHKGFQLFLLDEADGIAEFVFKGIETMASGGISIVLMTANPRSRSSKFHRIKRYSYVRTLRISSLYHPNVVNGREIIPGAVMRDFVEKQMEKGVEVVDRHDEEAFTFDLPYDVRVGGKLLPSGTIFKPTPEFMWTVLGIAPPTSLDKTVISVGVYEAAKKRVPQGGDPTFARVGVDAARSGRDNGTVYIRWQDVIWRSCELTHQDTHSYVEAIKTECLKLAEKGVTSLHIRVDAGYGSGVIDNLRIDAELLETFSDFQVFEVHFGGRAYNSKDYDNIVTEIYYEAAESLRDMTILSPPDALEVDLTEREYKFINRSGKTKKILEAKEDFAKRAGRSPDDGDGFCLAMAPDYCFNQVTVEVINVAAPAVPKRSTTVADDLVKRLGIKSKRGERVVITGWPHSGKTTLAAKLGGGRSTDEVKDMDWSDASAEVASWFDGDSFLIEGVAVPRALRKWKDNHPGKLPPIDKLIILKRRASDLNVAQIAMGKGLDSVLAEILPWLRQAGVKIEERE